MIFTTLAAILSLAFNKHKKEGYKSGYFCKVTKLHVVNHNKIPVKGCNLHSFNTIIRSYTRYLFLV